MRVKVRTERRKKSAKHDREKKALTRFFDMAPFLDAGLLLKKDFAMSVLRLIRSAFRFVRPRQNAEFTQTITNLQFGSL